MGKTDDYQTRGLVMVQAYSECLGAAGEAALDGGSVNRTGKRSSPKTSSLLPRTGSDGGESIRTCFLACGNEQFILLIFITLLCNKAPNFLFLPRTPLHPWQTSPTGLHAASGTHHSTLNVLPHHATSSIRSRGGFCSESSTSEDRLHLSTAGISFLAERASLCTLMSLSPEAAAVLVLLSPLLKMLLNIFNMLSVRVWFSVVMLLVKMLFSNEKLSKF